MKPSRSAIRASARQRRKTLAEDQARKMKLRARLAIAASALLLAGFIFVPKIIEPRAVNALTGCPLDNRAPEYHTIVLIDATDRLPASEIAYARSLIGTEYRWLPRYGKLTVRTITADSDDAQEITICGMPESSTSAGTLDNDKIVKARFDKIAGARFTYLYGQLADAPLQQASPLLEAVSGLAERDDFHPGVDHRRLVILSDFAQHSVLASHYRGRTALSEGARSQLATDLNGVEARLHYVRRRTLAVIQDEAHREFWLDYFRNAGARPALGHNLLIGENPDRDTWTYSPSEA